jgi:(S)-2-hydroxyglutarate dehydrogenase
MIGGVSDQHPYDFIIAGGGIIGLAAAWRLAELRPGTRLLVLEKEPEVARHQSGRNSGVIHSGIYYRPGSSKARLCRLGYHQLLDFAHEYGIAHEICGKVIVATTEAELPRLQALEERAATNGLSGVTRLDAADLGALEPNVAGIAALHVAETGIIDYVGVCRELVRRIEAGSGRVCTGQKVTALRWDGDSRVVAAGGESYRTRYFINCAGQYSDAVARMDHLEPGLRITPFRGEYYAFRPGVPALVRNLVYPVPDPNFPFLGVHFTRMVRGGVECGPNAVLALGREAYGPLSINVGEALATLAYPGFVRLARRHWRMGMSELHRSFSKPAFVRALQQLVPAVRAGMLERRPAGIRAQALRPDGSLVDDFAFAEGERSLHVLNAPSPAATASLAIGLEIAQRAISRAA